MNMKLYTPLDKIESFGIVLKNARQLKRLTIRQVSNELQFSYQHIWQIENIEVAVSKNVLDKLVKYYNLDIALLTELNFKNKKCFKRNI